MRPPRTLLVAVAGEDDTSADEPVGGTVEIDMVDNSFEPDMASARTTTLATEEGMETPRARMQSPSSPAVPRSSPTPGHYKAGMKITVEVA